jgi:hypothetical protein
MAGGHRLSGATDRPRQNGEPRPPHEAEAEALPAFGDGAAELWARPSGQRSDHPEGRPLVALVR